MSSSFAWKDIEARLTVLEASHVKGECGRPHVHVLPIVQESVANPGPLGLFAFSLTTILLSIKNTGEVEPEFISLVLGYAMMLGGVVQILAGQWEFKKKNTFAATAFNVYGAFWMGLSLWHILADAGIGHPSSTFPEAFKCYFAVFGVFSLGMFIGTFRINRALQITFCAVTILIFALVWGVDDPNVEKFAGWLGIFTGAAAFYTAWAQIINELYGPEVIPLGPWKKPHKGFAPKGSTQRV